MTEQAPHRLQRDTTGRRFLRYGSIGLVIAAVALNWWATQRAAVLIGFPPTGRIVGHLYQPFTWWWWQHRWPSGFMVPVGNFGVPIEAIWKACEHVVIYPLLVLGVVGGIIGVLLNHQQPAADLHGSATWANVTEITKAKLL
jgi:hypothetical protein